jgi:hypothetical protein
MEQVLQESLVPQEYEQSVCWSISSFGKLELQSQISALQSKKMGTGSWRCLL